jgi:hypothetical protein
MSLEGPQIDSHKYQNEWFVRWRVDNCTAHKSLEGPQIDSRKYQNEWLVRRRVDNCTALMSLDGPQIGSHKLLILRATQKVNN